MVGEYWYCAAKLLHQHVLGGVETLFKLVGSERHEEEAQETLAQLGRLVKVAMPDTLSDLMKAMRRQVSRALAGRRILANAKDRVTCFLVVPEYGCFGFPDEVNCRADLPIVVESKYITQLPGGPWPDHSVQTAVYMMGLEALGFEQPHGVLRYCERQSGKAVTFKVVLDQELREKVRQAALGTRAILKRKMRPLPTSNRRKCQVCEYRVLCPWRRDIENYHAPYFFDIETDLRGRVIWAIGAYSSKDFQLKRFFAERLSNEKRILRKFVEYIGQEPEAPVFSFSGSDFDYRILNDRLQHYGMSLSQHHIFTDICTRLRYAGVSGTLEEIAASVGYAYRHPELKGGAAWSYYERYLKSKNPRFKREARRILLEYNAEDVIALLKICANHPEPFEESLFPGPRSPDIVQFLQEIYRRLGRKIVRTRPGRRREVEVRFTSRNLQELQRIAEALKSIGYSAKIGPDKNAYAVRLYGFHANDFLTAIGYRE